MNPEQSDQQREPRKPAEPPGEGDTIEDAAREAVEEIEKTGNPHAGTGDGG